MADSEQIVMADPVSSRNRADVFTLFVLDKHVKDEDRMADEASRFSPGESETFVPSPSTGDFYCYYAGAVFRGPRASEMLRVAGIEVASQPFVDTKYAAPLAFLHFFQGYDGPLGLSPKLDTADDDPKAMRSPWASMVKGGLLKANIFALEPPTGLRDEDRVGEISFGSTNPKYEHGNFRSIPLLAESGFGNKAWAVSLRSIAWESEANPRREEFPNGGAHAVFSTANILVLPRAWVEYLFPEMHVLGCDVMNVWCEVDCAQQPGLPSLVFGLGTTLARPSRCRRPRTPRGASWQTGRRSA
ncbi:hypothetical protein PG994_000940 [Apiospora phragmitis]|uniref:Peptidase A1 domain-containing protein n=1 Tax=Apiospora phragmitis TaxID=2905665 RepID=A0ABR1WR27_9PEZI